MASQINEAIFRRDKVSFQQTLARRFFVCIFSVGFNDLAQHVQTRLSQVWHVSLTKRLHDRYFANQAFYHLGRVSMKDADQRIAVDAQETLLSLATIADKIASVALLGTYFTGIVYSEMG